MTRGLQAAALAFLASHQVMTLATHGSQGVWAAAVFYVNDGFRLYFLSAGHTRHAQNMAASPHCAATIQQDYQDWEAIQGMQMAGTVALLAGHERQTAVARYQKKYPFMAQPDPQIETAVQKVNWYSFQPDLLYLIDNRQELGHRDQVPLP